METKMKVKYFKIAVLVVALILSSATTSHAKATVTGGPYSNLALTGQVVNLKLAGYPPNAGFYIQQCRRVNSESRPQICNPNSQLWISTSLGADFAPSADILFKPTATFTYGTQTIDCVKIPCGIFIRLDHKATSDRSEDQFIPITFVGSTIPSANSDVITAVVNGKSIEGSRVLNVTNQSVFRLEARAKSGAMLTYSTLSSTCSLSGNQVTILQGVGYCEIDVYSPGNTQYSAITKHYLFKLALGNPRITVPTRVSRGASFTLPSETGFGAKISYEISETKNCTLSVNGSTYRLTFNKKGACSVRATAPGLANLYSELKQTISFKIA